MNTIRIKKITSVTYPKGKKAYCVSVNNEKHEVLVVGDSGNRYRIGQTTNFGILYGSTAWGLSRNLGIPVEEAEVFLRRYFDGFPKLTAFIMKAVNTVKKTKEIMTITKRRRHFKNYNKLPIPAGKKLEELSDLDKSLVYQERVKNNKSIERMAVNTAIQGSAADIMKIAMKNIHEKIKPFDAHLLISVHDEVIVEVPVKYAEGVMKIVKDCMEQAIVLKNVPLVTEPRIITKWEK